MIDEEEVSPRRCRVAPLAPLAAAVGLGVVVDRAAEPWGICAWAALALASLMVAVTFHVRQRRRGERAGWASVAIGLAWACLGGAWHHERYVGRAPDDLSRVVDAEGWGHGERRVAWVRGVVTGEASFRPGDGGPDDRGMTRLVVGLTAIRDAAAPGGWRPASGGVQAWVGGDRSDLRPGRAVEAAGQLSRVEGPLNPGEFDPRPMLRAEGVRLRLAVDGPTGIWADPAGADWPWTRRLGAVRDWSYRQLAAGLDPATVPLAAALLLGRRDAVSPEVNDAFARTGTTHLLAISGLHLQVLALVVAGLARAAGVGRRPAFLLVGLGTVGYAALVGFAPSVVRSAAMTVGVCLAGWRHRCATSGNVLAGAAILTILWDPGDLFDVGCQLSFLAVAAILWLVPAILAHDTPRLQPIDRVERQYEPWWRARRRLGVAYLREGLVGSAAVWLAAWPLVALRFHLVSPVAILVNLPLIPITSLALLLSGLSLASAAVWPPLAAPSAWGCGVLLGWTEAIVRRSATWRWGHVFTPGPDPATVATFYALLAAATIALASRWPAPVARRWWRLTAACGAWLALVPLIPIRPDVAEADVWAVGHGLAVALRSPSGRTALYDAGKLGDPHVGRRVVAPALWSRGVRRIDVLILSHADADHFNGVPDLLDRFELGVVRVPPGFGSPRNPGAARLVAEFAGRGIPVVPIAAGDSVDLGAGLTLTALHPRPGDESGTDNARSVVLEAGQGGRTLLLTGDLEHGGLASLLGRPAPERPVDALLAPHHGGRTSNPPALYDWARPRVVAVSQRPPAAGTRDPLAFIEGATREPPARLLRTWQSGAISLRWLPDGLAARGYLDPAAPAPNPSEPAPVVAAALLPIPDGLIGPGCGLFGLVAGAALALAVVAAEWGAWSLVAPGRRAAGPGREQDEAPGDCQRVGATAADGTVLVGDLFPARGGNPSGRTIVLLHGLAEDRRAFAVRVAGLVERGWDVAAVDARGSGESGGRWVTFGAREAGDLRTWLDALAARRVALALAPPRFAAWGRSMGAATATRAAADDPRLRALVLEAPFDDLGPAVAAVLRRMRVPGALAALVLWRARRLAGVSLDRPSPLALAPRVTAAVLVAHGSADALIPPARARGLARAIGGGAEFVEVPGAGHANVFEVGGPALAVAVLDFLDRAVPAD